MSIFFDECYYTDSSAIITAEYATETYKTLRIHYLSAADPYKKFIDFSLENNQHYYIGQLNNQQILCAYATQNPKQYQVQEVSGSSWTTRAFWTRALQGPPGRNYLLFKGVWDSTLNENIFASQNLLSLTTTASSTVTAESDAYIEDFIERYIFNCWKTNAEWPFYLPPESGGGAGGNDPRVDSILNGELYPWAIRYVDAEGRATRPIQAATSRRCPRPRRF